MELANTQNNKAESEINERSIVVLRESLKAAVTINGAAALAILGFKRGGENSSGTLLKIQPLQGLLSLFALEVLMAVVVHPIHHFEAEFDQKLSGRTQMDWIANFKKIPTIGRSHENF